MLTTRLDKKYQLSLNNDYYACMANELILARQKTMSIWANRIINFLVMQLVAEDKDLKTYSVKIKDLAEFVGVSTGNVYEDIKNACTEIMQTVIEISTGNPKRPWELLHWMSLARYDGEGTLTLSLSEEVKPYLFDLQARGFFTQYQIKEILPMSSFYAIRLYQYITMVMNKAKYKLEYVDMEIPFAREFFECENKYKQIGEFKKIVIDTAIKQINNNSSSRFWLDKPEYFKTGRVITKVRFYVRSASFIKALNGITYQDQLKFEEL
ncbi:replication initiation protein (plasmid) [Oscillospiraceae bacterium PP1C4]